MPLANATRLGRRKELMNDAVLRHTNGARTADACIAAAFVDLAATPARTLLGRYEARFNRQYPPSLTQPTPTP